MSGQGAKKLREMRVEDYEFLSVEYLYDYIRFNAFPSISDERKKKLFLKAFNLPLREPSIFKQIVEAVKADDFSVLESSISTNLTKTGSYTTITKAVDTAPVVENRPGLIAAVGGGQQKLVLLPVWPTILDAYFAETDKINAFNLFRTLLFFPINGDMTLLKDFIERYQKTTDVDARKLMVSNPVYSAFTI